jgi:proteasome lid subunit RPN8/RPN11
MLKIPKAIVEEIFLYAEREAPLEACGYLAGNDNLVIRHFRMTNVDRRTDHYSFDPEEQFAVVKEARKHHMELIAVYHSHPTTGARPSAEDIRLAYDPSVSYAIVSLEKRPFDLKSYKITDGSVTPEDVEIV